MMGGNKPANKEYYFFKRIKDGYLEIDEDGKVWCIATKHGENRFKKIPKREITSKNKAGYIQIKVTKNGYTYACLAHRLIWIYFNGAIPPDKQINHKNGIKSDNRLCNLELVTHLENQRHAVKTGLINTKGENHPCSRLTNEDIIEIRSLYSKGETQRKIAKKFNTCHSHISDIVNKKIWPHI